MKTSLTHCFGAAAVLILTCGLPSPGQSAVSPTREPSTPAAAMPASPMPGGCDVHVFMLERPEGELVAKVRAMGSRRLAIPETGNTSTARFVTSTGATTVSLSRNPNGGLSLNNETRLMRRGRLRGSQSESTAWRPDRPLFLMGDAWGSSAPSRFGTNAAIVWVVAADAATGEPAPQDTRALVAALIDAATSPQERPQIDVAEPPEEFAPPGIQVHNAPRQRGRRGGRSFGGAIAASVPLAHLAVAAWVPPETVTRLLVAGRSELAAIRASGARDAAPLLLAPLVALGELDAIEAAIAAREGAHGDFGGSRVELDAAMFVAFAGAVDPNVRGTAGWACFQRDPRAVTLALHADIDAGRAVLPGDAATATGRAAQIAATAAFMDIRMPALITAGGMLAFAALILVLRRVVDRWLFR